MKEEMNHNNLVVIMGKVDSEPIFNHVAFGEKFYVMKVLARRLSDKEDCIPLLISESLIDLPYEYSGKHLKASGQFRSHNQHDEQGDHLVLSVFVEEVLFMDEEINDSNTNTNSIVLEGNICKETIYRKTPLGREVTDLFLAVNRRYGKSDYIPCICWGGNARDASKYQVGDYVRISGRIQSREYVKRLSDSESELRTAYEVSANKVERFSSKTKGGEYESHWYSEKN